MLNLTYSSPVDTLAEISATASSRLNKAEKARLGAFFTPKPLAELIARIPQARDDPVQLGDFGAGTGYLSALTALHLARPSTNVSAYEIQNSLHPLIKQSYQTVSDSGTTLDHQIFGDFLADVPTLLQDNSETLSHAVINPPYYKLPPHHPANQALETKFGFTVPNVYVLFSLVTIHMLKNGGEFVALIPRSFTNGATFAPFRRYLTKSGSIEQIIRFNSRSNLFRGENILQENVVIHFVKNKPQSPTITITLCDTPNSPPLSRIQVSQNLFFHHDRFIIPATTEEQRALEQNTQLPFSADDLDAQLSTGKFISHKNPRAKPSATGTIPLITAKNFLYQDEGFRSLQIMFPQKLRPETLSPNAINPPSSYLLVNRIAPNDNRRAGLNPRILLARHIPKGAAISNGLQTITCPRTATTSESTLNRISRRLSSYQISPLLAAINGTTQFNKADFDFIRFA